MLGVNIMTWCLESISPGKVYFSYIENYPVLLLVPQRSLTPDGVSIKLCARVVLQDSMFSKYSRHMYLASRTSTKQYSS